MFSKPSEAEKVAALRRAALSARGNGPILTHNIRLRIEVHVGTVNTRSTGDLDNFITGICDSLTAAAAGSRIAQVFSLPANRAIDPLLPILFVDDCEVVEISARKIIDASPRPWYEVEVEGE